MKLILTALAFTLVSCGSSSPEHSPTLNRYVKFVEQTCDISVDYEVKMVAKLDFRGNDRVGGVCRKRRGKAVRVDVSHERWVELNGAEKVSLIAHEIAHCSLRMGHVDGSTFIMSPSVPSYPVSTSKAQMKAKIKREICPD